MFLQELLEKFGFSASFAGDVALVFLFAAFSVAFGLLVGRFKLINVLINVYIAIAILGVIPVDILSFHSSSNIILFAIIILMLNLVDNHLFDIHISGTGNSFFWRLFVMSFFEMGLIFSTVLAMLPVKFVLSYISVDAYGYFTEPYARLFWMIIPLVFLIFINKKQK
ncbi:hypothetical protein ACFL3M_00705 [Patescibacteria group bacterium]